jgi:hypothetical protein
MRRLVMFGATMALVAAVPAVVLAGSSATSSSSSGVNCQQLVWRTTSTSTSSTSFVNLPGMKATVNSIGAMIVNASVVISGAPFSLELTDTSVAGTVTVPPGPAGFTPHTPGTTSFSFTWTDPGDTAALHSHVIQVRWRTPAGGTATFHRGDVSVAYQTDPGTCPLN